MSKSICLIRKLKIEIRKLIWFSYKFKSFIKQVKSWAKETIGRPPFAVVGAAKEAYVNMIKWASRTGSSHSITEVFYLLINLKSDLLGSNKAYAKVKQCLGTG